MKRTAFNGRDLQTAFAIYQTYLAEGVTDVRELSRRLKQDIATHIKNLPPDRVVAKREMPVDEAKLQRELKRQHTERKIAAQKAGYCPECATGDETLNKKPMTIRMRLSQESTPQEPIFICPRCRFSRLGE